MLAVQSEAHKGRCGQKWCERLWGAGEHVFYSLKERDLSQIKVHKGWGSLEGKKEILFDKKYGEGGFITVKASRKYNKKCKIFPQPRKALHKGYRDREQFYY